MAEPVLRAVSISKRFPGVLALNKVNLDVYPGEVHALLGENGAGKSTLIKIISGVYEEDSGELYLDGKRVSMSSVRMAQTLGVATIYQELNLAPNLSVAENMFLGKEPRKRKGGTVIDRRSLRDSTTQTLESLGLNIDPDVPVAQLSVPLQQMVGIAKALSMDAKVIVFDEPTAALTEKETEALFDIISNLKAKGLGVIYISHRLEEIFRIADRATVFRDGRNMGTVQVRDTSTEELIKMMVGREIAERFPRRLNVPGEPILELRKICRRGALENVSLKVCEGEIVGLAGLMGSGRTEVARTIFGLDRPDSGEIIVFGKETRIASPTQAVELGIALVPEERRQQGLFLKLPVGENIVVSSLRRLFTNGLIKGKQAKEIASRCVNEMRIKTPSTSTPVGLLSGGNQQKVVVAKWLSTQARLLVFNEPTRGIDVGARRELYALMDELAGKGAGILIISSELPELIGMSDRIYVMHEGRVTAEYPRAEATQEKILKNAMGR